MSGWIIHVEGANGSFDVWTQGQRDHERAILDVIHSLPAGFRPVGWIRVKAGESGPYHDRKGGE